GSPGESFPLRGLRVAGMDPEPSARMADRSPDPGRGAPGLRRADGAAHGTRRRLGSARSAEDRQPPGSELSWPDPRERGPARGPETRRLQPDVGVCRARPQESRGATVADVEKREAAP